VYFGRLRLNEDRRPSKDWQEKKGIPFEKESKRYLQVATEDRIPVQTSTFTLLGRMYLHSQEPAVKGRRGEAKRFCQRFRKKAGSTLPK
jgi:hypothetical protein